MATIQQRQEKNYNYFINKYIEKVYKESRKYYGYSICYYLKKPRRFTDKQKQIIETLISNHINNFYGVYVKFYSNSIRVDWWTD